MTVTLNKEEAESVIFLVRYWLSEGASGSSHRGGADDKFRTLAANIKKQLAEEKTFAQ